MQETKTTLINTELLLQLIKRDIALRYKGSFLGIIWSILTPLLMLVIYTFVFSVIFQAKWQVRIDNKFAFALVLFSGLTVFNIFSETVSRSPLAIVSNPNFVKKIVFPLELLPFSMLGSAIVNGILSFAILIIANIILTGHLYWTIIFFPIVLMPLIIFTAGISLFISSLGVYIRDITQITPIAVTALLFLTPIFYPISAVPQQFRWFFKINPLAYTVEDIRRVILWGNFPDINWFLFGAIISIITFLVGYIWFKNTKRGFADVI